MSIVSPVERQTEPESNENSCSQGLASRVDEPAAITASTNANQPSTNLILHRSLQILFKKIRFSFLYKNLYNINLIYY